MKKLALILAVGASSLMMAQVGFGFRTNAVLNASSSSWKALKSSVNESISEKGQNLSGFNVGLSAKVDLPVTSLFVMPEVYFTHFTNKTKVGDVELKAQYNRFDVPVLLGYNIVGSTLTAFTGSVASYNITSDSKFSDFQEKKSKAFTMGYQFGVNVKLSNYVLNARYEGAFSKDQRKYIDEVANQEIQYDNRPSLFTVGLGYQF
ncbi:outer membrane beta-barrel protein [Riemerella columbipharyngis]|uniref:Outer membrane insertion C-terminal signal n=1 Tax=Riemerella columbipharyngis TaxID=1071918 RepID=A0A1G7EQJ3_9FLAO|nr:outer membrane beta-barrel protein [Riemerella columbipharyngis]SDE65970.1 outer membrane insertion C-terminal signal [Riemerella columbipharyngis]